MARPNIKTVCLRPEKLREGSPYWPNKHITASHFGIRAIGLRLAARFYYPGIRRTPKYESEPAQTVWPIFKGLRP